MAYPVLSECHRNIAGTIKFSSCLLLKFLERCVVLLINHEISEV